MHAAGAEVTRLPDGTVMVTLREDTGHPVVVAVTMGAALAARLGADLTAAVLTPTPGGWAPDPGRLLAQPGGDGP